MISVVPLFVVFRSVLKVGRTASCFFAFSDTVPHVRHRDFVTGAKSLRGVFLSAKKSWTKISYA